MEEENKKSDILLKQWMKEADVPASKMDWTSKVMQEIEMEKASVKAKSLFSRSFWIGAAMFSLGVIVSSIFYWKSEGKFSSDVSGMPLGDFVLPSINLPEFDLSNLWLYCGIALGLFIFLLVGIYEWSKSYHKAP